VAAGQSDEPADQHGGEARRAGPFDECWWASRRKGQKQACRGAKKESPPPPPGGWRYPGWVGGRACCAKSSHRLDPRGVHSGRGMWIRARAGNWGGIMAGSARGGPQQPGTRCSVLDWGRGRKRGRGLVKIPENGVAGPASEYNWYTGGRGGHRLGRGGGRSRDSRTGGVRSCTDQQGLVRGRDAAGIHDFHFRGLVYAGAGLGRIVGGALILARDCTRPVVRALGVRVGTTWPLLSCGGRRRGVGLGRGSCGPDSSCDPAEQGGQVARGALTRGAKISRTSLSTR